MFIISQQKLRKKFRLSGECDLLVILSLNVNMQLVMPSLDSKRIKNEEKAVLSGIKIAQEEWNIRKVKIYPGIEPYLTESACISRVSASAEELMATSFEEKKKLRVKEIKAIVECFYPLKVFIYFKHLLHQSRNVQIELFVGI